ncbi:O-antigen ligase family protein [Sphingomonas sp. MMS24-J13]|uniref:O-antigen ligase family protein n=1 Tax=Sphingomonas sp. MMS24-J13 TaxID=3238686 RepID=UPI00384AF6DD
MVIIIVLFFVSYVPLRWSAARPLRRHIGPGFVISCLVPYALGLFIHNGPIFLVSVLILFVATTRDRLDAICRFVMLALLLPQVLWFIHLGSLYIVTLNTLHVLGIGLLISYLIRPDRKSVPLRGMTIEDAFVAVMVLILWIGAGRFPSFTIFLRNGVAAGLMMLLPYIALRRGLRTSEEFMRVVACFALASVIVATFAVYETLHGWALFDTFQMIGNPDAISSSVYRRGGVLRAPSTMGSALMVGMVMLIGLTATLYSRRYVRSGWMIYGWGCALFLGMLMAQSRGNMALLPVAALIYFIQRRKYGFVAAIVAGAPIAFGVLLEAASVSPRIAGFLQIGVNSGGSSDVYDYRQLLFKRGMEEGAMHRWTGQGINDVIADLADITQGQHIVDLVNTYLTFYLTSGLLGMVPFFLLFAGIFWKLGTVRIGRLGNPVLAAMRGFALTALVVVAVQLTFVSFIDRTPWCLVIALVAGRMIGLERARLMKSKNVGGVATEAASSTESLPVRGRDAITASPA